MSFRSFFLALAIHVFLLSSASISALSAPSPSPPWEKRSPEADSSSVKKLLKVSQQGPLGVPEAGYRWGGYIHFDPKDVHGHTQWASLKDPKALQRGDGWASFQVTNPGGWISSTKTIFAKVIDLNRDSHGPAQKEVDGIVSAQRNWKSKMIDMANLEATLEKTVHDQSAAVTPEVLDSYSPGGRWFYIFTAMPSGQSLYDMLVGNELFKEKPEVLANLVAQLFSNAEQLAKAKVVHTDLNPRNIFVANLGGELGVQFINYEMAVRLADKEKTPIGCSPQMSAPEIVEAWNGGTSRGKTKISTAADVFTLTVLAYMIQVRDMKILDWVQTEEWTKEMSDGDREKLLRKMMTDGLPSEVSDKVEGLSEAVVKAFSRGLNSKPERRPLPWELQNILKEDKSLQELWS